MTEASLAELSQAPQPEHAEMLVVIGSTPSTNWDVKSVGLEGELGSAHAEQRQNARGNRSCLV